MKKIAILFVAFLCVAMIAGTCSATNTSHDKNSLVKSKSVSHSLKTIYILSNPSTGYTWHVAYDHSKVRLLNHKYIPTKPVICGSGGVNVFKFSGEKGAVITMYYKRVNESPIAVRKFII